MMKPAVRTIGVVGMGGMMAALGSYWIWFRPPPGNWLAIASAEQRESNWRKEKEWAQQFFTPIRDDPAFLAELKSIRIRLKTALDPEICDRLRRKLFENLVCRKTGDFNRYIKTCVAGRPAMVDPKGREMLERKYQGELGRPLSATEPPDSIFRDFWNSEYEADGGGKRFRDVAPGEAGSLIVIDELRDASQVLLLDADEQTRWYAWPGARRQRSIEMHPAPLSPADLLKRDSSCKFAQVMLLTRALNGDILGWFTNWFFDPAENDWELESSIAITNRRRYLIPI